MTRTHAEQRPVRHLQGVQGFAARRQLRQHLVVHGGNVAHVDVRIVQGKEFLRVKAMRCTHHQRVLVDVAAVRDVQTAQMAAVLRHRHGELAIELRAAGEAQSLVVRRARDFYTKGHQSVQSVEQRAGGDEGAVRDEEATSQRERLQLPAVLKNVLQRVV